MEPQRCRGRRGREEKLLMRQKSESNCFNYYWFFWRFVAEKLGIPWASTVLQAAEIGRIIQAENGVVVACDAIEKHLPAVSISS